MPDGLCARCNVFPPNGVFLSVKWADSKIDKLPEEETKLGFCGWYCKKRFVQGIKAMQDASMSLSNVSSDRL